jgi:adenylate kinase
LVTIERPHSESPVEIVLVAGPPGSGKGTQSARLAERRGWGHLSSGEYFRDEIARATPLGCELQALIDSGGLVPDELTLEIVLRALDEMPYRVVLLDGFPRTLPQAHALLDRTTRAVVRRVVELTLPRHVSFERLAQRSRSYDDVAAIRLRLAIYESQTRPAIDWLAGLGLVTTIDGDQPPDAVAAAMAARLLDICGAAGAPGSSTPSASSAASA